MVKEYGFENGKYSIIRDDQGDMRAFRNGLHWPTRTVDIIGDKLITSMLNEIDSLQEELVQVKAEMARRERYIKNIEACI